MVIEKFSVATWACQLKNFWSPCNCGNRKPFSHHMWLATEFGYHFITPIKFGHHQTMYLDCYKQIYWHFELPSKNR